MSEKKWRLSPSGASTWIPCPGSVLLSAKAPEEAPSEYADEGTAAHSLGESRVRQEILGESSAEAVKHQADGLRDKWDVDEMWDHLTGYVELLREKVGAHGQLLLEQRMFTGVPTCWGTADAVIIHPNRIEIVDLKYGAGEPVDAVGNPQLRLYGVAALDTFELLGDLETVVCTVYQPRVGEGGSTSSEELSAADLRAWRDTLIPIAEEALAPGAPFAPGPVQCRWCDAAGVCTAKARSILEIPGFQQDPDLLSPEAMADLLGRADEIQKWLSALKAAGLALARDGKVPGYKVVMSGSRRYIDDGNMPALIAALEEKGFSREDLVREKPQTFGHLEKLVGGRKQFDEVAGEYVSMSRPNPSLVKDSDPRPGVDRASEASEVFKE